MVSTILTSGELLKERLGNLHTDESLNWEYPINYVEYELSPLREYYAEFPEAFLMYLNEEIVRDPLKGEDFKLLVQFTFARYGVDFMHPGFNLRNVREQFFYFLKSRRKNEVEVQRLRELFDNDSVFDDYIKSRVNEADLLLSKEHLNGKI